MLSTLAGASTLFFRYQSRRRILDDHEAGVEAALFHQEGGEATQVGVHQPLQAALEMLASSDRAMPKSQRPEPWADREVAAGNALHGLF